MVHLTYLETLLFTDKITKINRYGMNQERDIMLTNVGIYNLKKKCIDLFI